MTVFPNGKNHVTEKKVKQWKLIWGDEMDGERDNWGNSD